MSHKCLTCKRRAPPKRTQCAVCRMNNVKPRIEVTDYVILDKEVPNETLRC